MNYQIYFEAEFKKAGWQRLTDTYEINWNLWMLIVAALGATPRDWDGMLASDLEPKLVAGLTKLEFHTDEFERYARLTESGTVVECKLALFGIRALCQKYPFATVREVADE